VLPRNKSSPPRQEYIAKIVDLPVVQWEPPFKMNNGGDFRPLLMSTDAGRDKAVTSLTAGYLQSCKGSS
jgi:hypothetical protein